MFASSSKGEGEFTSNVFSGTTQSSSKTTISFSLARKGYNTLTYFSSTSSSIKKYTFLDSYGAIIEPYNQNEIKLIDGESDLSAKSFYRYSICPADDSTATCATGVFSSTDSTKSTAVTIDCEPFDEYKVILTEYDASSTQLRSSSITAVCMYVRREITALNAVDLESTMNAMHVLWEHTEEEGQALYGEEFHTASYFASAHDFNAAQQNADHIHEGLGFLPQHIKLTNMFEVAVQAVDPSVSLPYWDFTKDVAENKTIYESFVFTEDTFGSITKPSDSYWGFLYSKDVMTDTKIQDGRWAGLLAENNSAFSDVRNGFGYMRGPWNMNPSPYVSRFSAYSPSLPSCSDYYAGLSMPDNLMEFLESAPYGAHASTHGVIGGVFGCDKLDPLRTAGIINDEDSQLSMCKKWGFYMKELYRSDYIKAKEDCAFEDLTEEGISCGFTCKDGYSDYIVSAVKALINPSYVSSSITTDDWQTVTDFICTGDGYKVFVGDHLESASPADPSFWPIHPTQERLLQAKFMTGAFSDTTWATDAVNDYVCDKPSCFSASEGVTGYYDECCYGHFESDRLLDFANGNSSAHVGDTNIETLDNTNPASEDYGMTYVYDNFEWNHCEEDFDSLVVSLYHQINGV